jgi:hypothetical protein
VKKCISDEHNPKLNHLDHHHDVENQIHRSDNYS